MSSLQKIAHRIVIASSLFIILTITTGYLIWSKSSIIEMHPVAFCGTVSPKEYFVGNGKAGKQLFNTHCAACHRRDKRLTGPALANSDALFLQHWLTKSPDTAPKKFTSSPRDYHQISFDSIISSKEIAQLQDYLESYYE